MVGARRRRRSHAVTLPGASSLARADAPNLAAILLGEPQVAIRPGRDAVRSAQCRGGVSFHCNAAAGRDARNVVPNEFREPEIAIRAGRDARRITGSRELSDAASGGDAPDLANEFREPEVAIRAGRDARRLATGRGDGELSDAATGSDAPDLVPKVLGEPQVAIRPDRNAAGEAIMRVDAELSDAATGGDAPDLANEFREPEVAIRAGRDARRPATGRGGGELGDPATGGDAPDLARIALGEPEVAIRPGRDAPRDATARGGGELGDGIGQDESTAQAQQADTGNQGGAEGDQVRPQSRNVHVSSSFSLLPTLVCLWQNRREDVSRNTPCSFSCEISSEFPSLHVYTERSYTGEWHEARVVLICG